MRLVMYIFIIAGVGGLAYLLFSKGPESSEITSDLVNGAMVDVTIPASLTANAQVGQNAFVAKCSSCHGVNAVGREGAAPPLIHKIYEPSHHGDESFQRAVATGVRQHHWPFGNMPPIEGLTRGDVAMIVTYVRELQRANDIK